jgi:hypothetical protein
VWTNWFPSISWCLYSEYIFYCYWVLLVQELLESLELSLIHLLTTIHSSHKSDVLATILHLFLYREAIFYFWYRLKLTVVWNRQPLDLSVSTTRMLIWPDRTNTAKVRMCWTVGAHHFHLYRLDWTVGRVYAYLAALSVTRGSTAWPLVDIVHSFTFKPQVLLRKFKCVIITRPDLS